MTRQSNMTDAGVGRSGADAPSGCQPTASAAISVASSQSGIPNAEHYATLVFSAPTDEELKSVVRPIFESAPLMGDKSKPRIVAMSWSQDAMSVLDAIVALAECDTLDAYELRDCVRETAQLRTWEQCLAKFAEWDLEYRDGELVDLREEQAP